MKILVFHQPFPMGNYLLNQVVANHLQSHGHEVYVLEQLNGRPCTPEYMQQILDADFDVCYFEMLDHETFKIVEQLKCKRILLFASAGVLGEYDKILNYHSVWYDMAFVLDRVSSLYYGEKIKKILHMPPSLTNLLSSLS